VNVTLRPPRPGEAGELTELILRSKAYWGYDQAFMAMVRSELALAPDDARLARTVVAELDGRTAGVLTLGGEPPECEIDLLFVDPWAIGAGVGRVLFDHAVDIARAAGYERLRIDADPQAEAFYLHLGAVRVAEAISPSSGRSLPMLHYPLSR
jgi:GNAT superfamily N-acetyltransferase